MVQTGKEGITSAVRITSAVITCNNFGVVVHKLLLWLSQTFAALFTNFCPDIRKLLPRCSQIFAVALINLCRIVHKLLPWFYKLLLRCSNFCRGFYKLLPRCSQTFAVLFTNFCSDFLNFCRIVKKILLLFF